MSDIFGRSTSARKDTITRQQITSMIKRYVTSGLNLVDVDPGEIVVFETDKGKLKTSNLSFDDLLTKQPTADADSIVVFKQGKLEPSYKITTITDKFDTIKINETMVKALVDSLTQLRTEYYSHVSNFVTLRRNFNLTDSAIEKFFGKINIKPDEIKTTFADITTNQQKSTDDIADIDNVIEKFFGKKNIKPNEITTTLSIIKTVQEKSIDAINLINSRLGVIRDNEKVSDLIAINKKSIDDIKPIIDKVKNLHNADRINNIVYVVDSGFSDFVQGTSFNSNLVVIPSKGIYRFSLVSEYQFNLKFQAYEISSGALITLGRGVNTVLINWKNDSHRSSFDITPIDSTVVRTRVYHILEYLLDS